LFKGEAVDKAIAAFWHAADEVGGNAEIYTKLMLLMGKRRTALSMMRWEEVDSTGYWSANPTATRSCLGSRYRHWRDAYWAHISSEGQCLVTLAGATLTACRARNSAASRASASYLLSIGQTFLQHYQKFDPRLTQVRHFRLDCGDRVNGGNTQDRGH